MELVYKNWIRKAVFIIENQNFILKYNSFWNSNFEIKDKNNIVILKSFKEKWFSNSTILEYKGRKFKIKIRNNRLAEYVIFDGSKEVLAYGLETNSGKTEIKITSNTTDYLLDYLLWYIFVPIAQENIGDKYNFQNLVID